MMKHIDQVHDKYKIKDLPLQQRQKQKLSLALLAN